MFHSHQLISGYSRYQVVWLGIRYNQKLVVGIYNAVHYILQMYAGIPSAKTFLGEFKLLLIPGISNSIMHPSDLQNHPFIPLFTCFFSISAFFCLILAQLVVSLPYHTRYIGTGRYPLLYFYALSKFSRLNCLCLQIQCKWVVEVVKTAINDSSYLSTVQ